MDRKWAPHLAFLSAIFLTIDAALQYFLFHNWRLSVPAAVQTIRFLISLNGFHISGTGTGGWRSLKIVKRDVGAALYGFQGAGFLSLIRSSRHF